MSAALHVMNLAMLMPAIHLDDDLINTAGGQVDGCTASTQTPDLMQFCSPEGESPPTPIV